jgi:hypothetical protein
MNPRAKPGQRLPKEPSRALDPTRSAGVDLFDAHNDVDLKLVEARATLDLIYTALVHGDHDQAQIFLETLGRDTLSDAVKSAIRRIEEARDGLEQLDMAERKRRNGKPAAAPTQDHQEACS